MVVKHGLHTNGGQGETSYAKNSTTQRTGITKARPFLEEAIKNSFGSNFSNCFKVADLGCSSGPNTLLTLSEIIETIHGICEKRNLKSPEFQIFLNDLPKNDFNTIFRSLLAFVDELKKEKGDKFGPYFISGMPGSFYERLFPSKSLHFVHSSYSLHWLSQLPAGLEINMKNVYIAKTSPPEVFKAYIQQFQKDFSTFLHVRSEEIVSGGCVFLTLLGRSVADPTSNDGCLLWELFAKSLLDIASEGLIEEADIDSFNLPIYLPFKEELRMIIHEEGSFNLVRLETFEVNWDPNDDDNNKDFVFNNYESGQNVANCIRAVAEPVVASHFGTNKIENLCESFAKHVAEHLAVEKTKYFNIVISLIKK